MRITIGPVGFCCDRLASEVGFRAHQGKGKIAGNRFQDKTSIIEFVYYPFGESESGRSFNFCPFCGKEWPND